MDNTNADLNSLRYSLDLAGRYEDAALIDRAIELLQETGQWIACLKCSAAVPTIEAKREHDRMHRY